MGKAHLKLLHECKRQGSVPFGAGAGRRGPRARVRQRTLTYSTPVVGVRLGFRSHRRALGSNSQPAGSRASDFSTTRPAAELSMLSSGAERRPRLPAAVPAGHLPGRTCLPPDAEMQAQPRLIPDVTPLGRKKLTELSILITSDEQETSAWKQAFLGVRVSLTRGPLEGAGLAADELKVEFQKLRKSLCKCDSFTFYKNRK